TLANRGGDPANETAAASTVEQVAVSGAKEPQEEASYTPPRRRRAGLPTPPNLKALEIRRRRVERWRSMDIGQLEREYAIMKFTARKSTHAKQRFALECQVKELEHEIARARGRGMRAMEQVTDDVQVLPLPPAAGEQ